jgi:hypothetical protein
MLTLSFISFFWSLFLTGNGPQFPATNLPAALTEHADVVVRLHETEFRIKNTSEATEKVHCVYTILNKDALADAMLQLPYSNLKKIVAIKGVLYNKEGREVQRLKTKDIYDLGGITSNLIDDVRVKVASLKFDEYPFTVEYEYEISYTGSLFYPVWQPQEKQNHTVEYAAFKVISPKETGFRFKPVNGAELPRTSTEGNNQIYVWEIRNLAATEYQLFQPAFREITPLVYTAPNDFSVEQVNGNMNTWANFGNWIAHLNQGKDKLPESTVTQVKALVANEPDDLARIKKLYAYLQQKTRYVSVQLGLGGWQPFEAAFVDAKGYGDCKALTNYMQALLKAAGINSHYTLIRAGENEPDILKDFPSNQFNHALLCVPTGGDTLWLECTSQTGSWGYNGSFTGNRHGLLITPQGGKLVRTTTYGAEKNQLSRNATITLDASGNAAATMRTVYTGLQQDEIRLVMAAETETQRKWLNRKINLPNFAITTFSFKAQDGRLPEATENLVLNAGKYASQSGKRFFLNPNFANRFSAPPLKKTERKLPIVLNTPYTDTDAIVFQLPAGAFQAESLPEPVSIKSIFGEYRSSCTLEAGEIMYSRTLKMNSGRFPAASYPELTDFYKKISAADKMQVVLLSKT